jgi:hypothetical protein
MLILFSHLSLGLPGGLFPCGFPLLNPCPEVEVEVNLRPTVSRPVRPGVGLLSGAHDQIFVFCPTVAGFLMCGTLSDERTGL